VHWKNVVTDEETFRKELLAAVDMTIAQWSDYWAYLKAYRDTCVAHHDPKRELIPHYPKLQPALDSALFYYDYVRAELLKLDIRQQPEDMRSYAKDFESKCAEAANAALAATKTIIEPFS